MAYKLADELLQMIISPSLHISDKEFTSTSPDAFGRNDRISSSSVLIVCKRWLKVATPLLYEVIVLRSTAQAQALSEAFSRNPTFAFYVKNIRLEGAYSCLWDVFKHCLNLHTILFTLDLYADVPVNGLCRALSAINPTRVILHDGCDMLNAKVKQVFSTLLQAIPKWKNLTEFDFPYAQSRPWSSNNFKPDQLAVALSASKNLRKISAAVPSDWDEVWCRLAKNSRLWFIFDSERSSTWLSHKAFFKAVFASPDLMKRIDIINTSSIGVRLQEKHPSQAKVSVPKETSFNLLDTLHSNIEKSIWSRIIAFAVSPGHPDSLDFSNGMPTRHAQCSFNLTRKSLSLVSKKFHDLTEPFLFRIPLFVKDRSLTRFVSLFCQNPSLLRQMRVLSLSGLGGSSLSDVDFELSIILPHLTGLEHFVGDVYHPISSKIFDILSEASGNTLISISKLSITPKDPVPGNVFRRFRKLTSIDFVTSPQIVPELISATGLSSSDVRCACPSLTSAKVSCDSAARSFFQVCGKRLLRLEITQFSSYVDIFRRCPNLVSLEWNMRPKTLSSLLLKSSGHSKLIKISVPLNPSHLKNKDYMSGMALFFSALELALPRISSLREIHLSIYRWPVDPREISKDLIVKQAIRIKKAHGVDFTDESGKAWRMRAEKRW